MIDMELIGVRVEMPANAPLIILREREGTRLLPIYIGGAEAQAIQWALDEKVPPRPMTHDLLRNVLTDLGAQLVRIDIIAIADRTFFAELQLRNESGEPVSVSARPSDAVALAVRVGCPIWCEENVLAEAGQEPEPEAEELVDEFREFLDQISPDDFAG